MRCFMCQERARVICMCANPRAIICFNHIRNHTGGRSIHRLRCFEAYQDQQLIHLAISTITSITHHIISAATKEFKEQSKQQIKKLSLSIGSNQRIQNIQEIKISNEKMQLKIQQSYKYLTEFKTKVYQMREQISKVIIYRHCSLLMKILPLDSFIEKKIRWLYEENRIRFAGKIEVSYNNGAYTGEFENGLPEGRGVFTHLNGGVYDGEFKGGQAEGRGVYKYPDGAVYDGE